MKKQKANPEDLQILTSAVESASGGLIDFFIHYLDSGEKGGNTHGPIKQHEADRAKDDDHDLHHPGGPGPSPGPPGKTRKRGAKAMNDFSRKVPLGRTGMMVSRLGIGSAYGVSETACRKAFEAGVNYFFWGSVRTPGMALAIRRIAARQRDDLIVVLECYGRNPRMMRWSVERGLRRLGIDRADILLLGWHDSPPGPHVLETAERLKDEGKFRFLGISSHQRPLFRGFLADGRYDVFHIRYNAAHRGAQTDIFPHLPAEGEPGIVSFTNTRWGDLLNGKKMPPGMKPLTATDCYRFALSSGHVHTAICGPENDREMDEALAVLQSAPLEEGERERIHAIGDHVHGISSFMSLVT
jgi:aryl-alcohol dehydrogenase-like predicted oxidoreductase